MDWLYYAKLAFENSLNLVLPHELQEESRVNIWFFLLLAADEGEI